MRDRHKPRLCTKCTAPLGRQEDICWRCATPVAANADGADTAEETLPEAA